MYKISLPTLTLTIIKQPANSLNSKTNYTAKVIYIQAFIFYFTVYTYLVCFFAIKFLNIRILMQKFALENSEERILR